MKMTDLATEQKQFLTTKLLRIAQIKKIDTIKVHRQVLMDILNDEGHCRTVHAADKNSPRGGTGIVKVETYRSPAHRSVAVRLDRQLQADWDKLVIELTPQPDLLARLLYHKGAEMEEDLYGEKVDRFMDVLIGGMDTLLSEKTLKKPDLTGHLPLSKEFISEKALKKPDITGQTGHLPLSKGAVLPTVVGKDKQPGRGYVCPRECNQRWAVSPLHPVERLTI